MRIENYNKYTLQSLKITNIAGGGPDIGNCIWAQGKFYGEFIVKS
jgi:hypothetical protein